MIGALVILCIAAVAAQKQAGPPAVPAGCANPPTPFKKLSECCANFPTFFSKKDMAEKCGKTCMGKGADGICCATDCVLNAAGVITDGKFDAKKAKTEIAKMVAGNAAWTSSLISSIVDGCVSSAPNKLNDWRSKVPAELVPKCSEATSLNMVIGHCIRREMFFQCPGLIKTGDCKALVDYGQGCPVFPFHDGLPGKEDKKDDKKDKKKKPEPKKP